MRTRAMIGACLTALLLLAGCATQKGFQFTGAGGPYPARTAADKIEVFDKDPGGKPYQTIGNLKGSYISNTVLVVLKDVLPQIQAKAAEAGGDAVIVREAGYTGAPSPNKPFNLSADVIRYQP